MDKFNLIKKVEKELSENGNKISPDFIDKLAEGAYAQYFKAGNVTRICALTLGSGHTVVGVAKVIDPKNDDETLGNAVAFNKAKSQLWDLAGGIAKCMI